MSNSLYRLLKLAEVVYDSEDEVAIKSIEAQFDCYVKKCCVAHFLPHNDGNTPNPWRRQMDYTSWENSPYYGSVSEFMKKFPGGIKEWREWRKKTQKERNQLWDDGPTKTRQARIQRITELTGISKCAVNQLISYISRELSIPENFLKTLSDLQLKDIKILIDLGKKKEARDKYTEYQIANQKVKKAHYVPEGPDDVEKFEKEPHLYSDEGLEKYKSVEDFEKSRKTWRESDARDTAKHAVKDFLDYWKLLMKVPERRKNRGRKKKND